MVSAIVPINQLKSSGVCGLISFGIKQPFAPGAPLYASKTDRLYSHANCKLYKACAMRMFHRPPEADCACTLSVSPVERRAAVVARKGRIRRLTRLLKALDRLAGWQPPTRSPPVRLIQGLLATATSVSVQELGASGEARSVGPPKGRPSRDAPASSPHDAHLLGRRPTRTEGRHERMAKGTRERGFTNFGGLPYLI
jgi:hypothetical protein